MASSSAGNFVTWDGPAEPIEPKKIELVPIHDAVTGVILKTASEIAPEAVKWRWEGQLAVGKFQVVAGPPGVGKSALFLAIAATISVGGRWPDGTQAEPGVVVIQAGEDDLADTVVPRLKALGADLENIELVAGYQQDGRVRPFDPTTDFDDLCVRVRSLGKVALILVDPVIVFVRGSSNDSLDVRHGLQQFVELAGETGATIVGVTHFSKSSAGRDALERVIGSQAFAALPRLVHVVTRTADGERFFIRAKSNIGPDGGAYAYDIEDRDGVAAAVWGRFVDGDSNSLLSRGPAESASRLDAAKEWLSATLAGGSTSAKDVEGQATAAGHAARTLDRAKKELGVVTTRVNGAWFWSLPSLQERQERQASDTDELGVLGALAPQSSSPSTS